MDGRNESLRRERVAGKMNLLHLWSRCGVAGGIMRNLLTGEPPLLLRDRESYASAPIAGAALYLWRAGF